MTFLQRSLIGGAIGSLAVLAVHPVSREFLLSAFYGWGPEPTLRSHPLIVDNLTSLPPPASAIDASLWFDAGSRAIKLNALGPADTEKLIRVCRSMGRRDPDNAYWTQLLAVFLAHRGDQAGAREAWIHAAGAIRWDNQRAARTRKVLESLDGDNRHRAAWHAAALYRLESSEALLDIDRFGRALVRGLGFKDRSDLLLRFATLANGRLVRDGARTLKTGEVGAGLVEAASYPADLSPYSNPRKLLIARTELVNALHGGGMAARAQAAEEAFRSNDGWTALTPGSVAEERFRLLGWLAMASITVPGATFCMALVGINLWGLAELMRRRKRAQKLISSPGAAALGIALGAIVAVAAGNVLAGLAVAACAGFLGFTPSPQSAGRNRSLGPNFAFVVGILVLTSAGMATAGLAGLMTPGWEVLSAIRYPTVYTGASSALLTPALLSMSLLAIVAPAFAYLRRVPTSAVALTALSMFGKQMFVGCLAFSIIATPICVNLDRAVGDELRRLVTNEPLYYLSQ